LLAGAGCQDFEQIVNQIKEAKQKGEPSVTTEVESGDSSDDTEVAKKTPSKEGAPTISESVVEKVVKNPIANVPKEVNNFLVEDDLVKLQSKGFKVYKGATPPIVVGNYVFLAKVVSDGNFPGAYPVGYELSRYIYSFKNQNGSRIETAYNSYIENDDAKGAGSFISGSGNCFTVFNEKKGTDDGCSYASAELASGCVADGGISNFSLSYIAKSKSGSNCEDLMPVGNFRVINDAFAEKTDSAVDQGDVSDEDSSSQSPEDDWAVVDDSSTEEIGS
jgi:hypothetical protein